MAQGASRGLVAVSAGALLGGCSSGSDGAGPKDPGTPSDLGVPRSGGAAPKASPNSAGPDFTMRPDRVPDTAARAGSRIAARAVHRGVRGVGEADVAPALAAHRATRA